MSTVPSEPQPPGAKKWGKCPGCGEWNWLFEFEGTDTDAGNLMCEGCIDEFHDSVHEAEDAMAERSEPEDVDWPEEFYEEPDGAGYF